MLMSDTSNTTLQQFKLTRREANILYALSAIPFCLGSLLLYFGWVRHFGRWILPFTIIATYLCGGGTIYVILHWRDPSLRRQPKLTLIHCFNLLSSVTTMPGFLFLAMVLHYLQR
jgi:hypothetical protein